MSDSGVVLLFTMTILGGVALMIAAMHNRRKLREMEHRERLAMIERGVVPAPESDPAGFEAGAGIDGGPKDTSQRYRTAGVLLIGFGFGLMFVIGVAAGARSVGFGIGAAWVSLGAASLLNYWLSTRRRDEQRRRWTPPTRPDQPDTAP